MNEPLLPDASEASPGTTHPQLRRALLWERQDRDPMKYYEIVAILGIGSMGSVSKVRKRGYAIGGSARDNYVKAERGDLAFRLKLCWTWCCGDEQEEGQLHHRTILAEESNGPISTSNMVQYKRHATVYAMKTLDLTKAKSRAYVEELKNEVEILKTLDHPNIICAVETFSYKTNLYVIMEHCSGGDLYVRDPYTEEEAAHIVSSILSAVAYMHDRNITHRDLKYENVMFTDLRLNAGVKVIDFGLSKKYGSDKVLTDAVGTVYTMSPEVFERKYTNKVDLWSIGVIAYMLLSSSMPFCGGTRFTVIRAIKRGTFDLESRRWKTISSEAKDFVKALLQVNPDERPTAEQAMKLPFLVNVSEAHAQRSANAHAVAMDVVQASIELYASYSTLKKLALVIVAHKSNSDEIGFLRSMFQTYDTSHNGSVDLDEFRSALRVYDYSDDEVKALFDGIDIDGTGRINYYEFLAATIEAHGEITEQRLAEAFDRIDSDDSGYITVENLGELLGEAPRAYLDRIVQEADEHPDDKIYYHEFLGLWNAEDDIKRREMLDKVASRRLGPSVGLEGDMGGSDDVVQPNTQDLDNGLSIAISGSHIEDGKYVIPEDDEDDYDDEEFPSNGNGGQDHGVVLFKANKASSRQSLQMSIRKEQEAELV